MPYPTIILACGLLLLGAGATALDTTPRGTSGADPVDYHAFGAVGDGKTDDFDAIIAAHEHANRHGLPVRARDGATYCIGGGKRTAEIRTDTDFGTAAFIIDDSHVPVDERGFFVFRVAADRTPMPITGLASLRKGQDRLGVRLPARSLVEIIDGGTKRFIRRGSNQNAGQPQREVLIVGVDGAIDASAPSIWDFTAITEAKAQPIDDRPLTIRGGRFTTIANRAPSAYTYYGRGLRIERSLVTVDGLTHLVTCEGDTGAPYLGFINISRAAQVTVRNCVLTAHKTYHTIGSAGRKVAMGSYDLGIDRSIDVSIVNVTQSNDIQDDSRWPIMGSNYSKNIVYDGCTLSRFDAHNGLGNGTIRNSTVRHIALTGWGTFRIENSVIPNSTLISLRGDYGGTWDGDIIIRDCTLAPPPGRPVASLAILSVDNDGRHDFGYPCHMPRRIDVDGLRVLDKPADPSYPGLTVIQARNVSAPDAPYQYVRTREVVIRNLTAASGLPARLSDRPEAFTGTRWDRE